MEPIPLRMRQRILELYDQGKRTQEISGLLGTCRSATRRVRQRLRERGTLEPARPKAGRKGGLTEERAALLRGLVAAAPDATRAELRERLGVSADVRTVGRWLAKLGLPLKKSRPAPPSRTVRT